MHHVYMYQSHIYNIYGQVPGKGLSSEFVFNFVLAFFSQGQE